MGHFPYDCPNTTKKPLSERPNAYQQTKSPGPNQRNNKPPMQNAHVAVQGPLCRIEEVFEWDKEEAGLVCVIVHTTPVSVGSNIAHFTGTVTNLIITTHTPAPSLLDDGDIESQPGPPSQNISPDRQFQSVREREAFQESQQQFTSSIYVEDDSYSDTPSFANEQQSQYSIQSSQVTPFTDEMVVELLKDVDTAQGDLHHHEQAQRMRAHKPTLYVRQLSPGEIIETATS
jgi:hypothetical protein